MSKFGDRLYVTSWPQIYAFTPQDDITPLEAAHIGAALASVGSTRWAGFTDYPQWNLIERHFTIFDEKAETADDESTD